jgi:hypothetical protein
MGILLYHVFTSHLYDKMTTKSSWIIDAHLFVERPLVSSMDFDGIIFFFIWIAC